MAWVLGMALGSFAFWAVRILHPPMTLDFENLAPRDVYAWMSNTITPRPIAWVSTISAEGKTNLAPFSYFQAICSNPPTLLFTGTVDRNGRLVEPRVTSTATFVSR